MTNEELKAIRKEQLEEDEKSKRKSDFIVEFSSKEDWRYIDVQVEAEYKFGSFHNFSFPLKIYGERVKK